LPSQLGTDGLHHHLVVTRQLVDLYGQALLAGAHQQQREPLGILGQYRLRHAEHGTHVAHRVAVPAVFDAFGLPLVTGHQVLTRNPDDDLGGTVGNGIDVVRDLHQQRLGNGQREGQADDEAAAATVLGHDLQGTTQLLDFAHHGVHAHTASRHLGHFRSGGETRLQDELVERVLLDLGALFEQAILYRLPADGRGVQAGTIVRYGEHHLAAFTRQHQGDPAGFRLVQFAAFFRRFDTVRHGIAQQVLQRPHDAVEDGAVDLAFRPDDVQLGLLAQGLGGLPHYPLQA